MSKRPKHGIQGLSIPRPTSYSFERSQPPPIDDIAYDDDSSTLAARARPSSDADGEIDPLDAFMAEIHEEIRAPPPPPAAAAQPKAERFGDEDDDPVESFLRAKKDAGLALPADALRAGYDSDEEVYAAAKAVDAGMVEYDSDGNPIFLDKKKIEPIPALDHAEIEYDSFTKDFYEEKPSISGSYSGEHLLVGGLYFANLDLF